VLLLVDNLVPNAANEPYTVARTLLSIQLQHTNVSQLTLAAAGLLVMPNEEAGDFPILTAPPDPLAPNHSYLHWDTDVYTQYGTGGANGPLHYSNEGWKWDVTQRRRLREQDRLCLIISSDPGNTENLTFIIEGRLLLLIP